MKVDLKSADYTTLSRRGKVLDLPTTLNVKDPNENLVFINDSTGLKIFGAGEWSETKHGLRKKRKWNKLHLTVNGQYRWGLYRGTKAHR